MDSANNNHKARVAILLDNHFEDSEFKVPYTAFQQANLQTVILGSRMNDEYQGKQGKVTAKPDATFTEVRAEDFEAIFIPGGAAPDKIRTNDHAVRLVMNAMALGKLIAAICHGPQVLIEADQLRGKRATGYRAIRKDMQNAGATYVDEPVVVQSNLITARQPGDLPMFTTVLLRRLEATLENITLPEVSDQTYDWWKLAQGWGGSTRQEIVKALNTALTGESYTAKAFELYLSKTHDSELKTVFREISTGKYQHIEMINNRLRDFDESNTWQTLSSEAFATLQSWLQSSDDVEMMRKALGDLQTGIVDAQSFCSQLTDPTTVFLLNQVKSNLQVFESRLGDLYRARLADNVQPPLPTTMSLAG